MTEFEHDSNRIAGCVGRLRFSMRLAPWVLVPATGAVFSIPGIALGPMVSLSLAAVGLIAGYYLSAILAAVLEWMALMLIGSDLQHSTSSQTEP